MADQGQDRTAVGEDGGVGALSRERIVEAALALARRDGLDALTMRRLADELDVTAMATYRHVAGKADLLQAMAEQVWDSVLQLPLDELPDDPLERVVAALVRARHALLDHGDLALVAAWRPTPSPSVVANVSSVVDALRDLGFTTEQIPAAYSTLVVTGLGHIQFEVARAGFDREAGGPRPVPPLDGLGDLDPATISVLAQIAADPDRTALFEFGIRRLLDGLLAWSAGDGPPPDLDRR